MSRSGIRDAFARYGATLRNAQWSVSAWTPSEELVVSQWQHHYRPGPGGTAEYAGTLSRWSGPGNTEFRANLERAYREQRSLRLVIVSTIHTDRMEAGEDASKIPKDFHAREDLVGEVVSLTSDAYVIRFRRKG